MVNITLKYDKNDLNIVLDDDLDVTVVEPKDVPGLKDPIASLKASLENPIGEKPLRQLVRKDMKVGIVFSDITRATPSAMILPVVLDQIQDVPRKNITLFNALGTHRENTDAEMRQMLGDDIVGQYRIIQNNCNDVATQVHIGKTSFGHEIWVNKAMKECDLIILTGFIEPHFFAGFSGGGKAIMPGMAGTNTIFGNHDAGMIANAKSTWGITNGNPIWEEVTEVAEKTGKLFLVNVTMNNHHEVSGVFCGNLRKAHAAGCAFVKNSAMVQVDDKFDIVITTNSGYPLDLNLYQSVKGMSAAAQILKKGGKMVIATGCSDGIPEHGLFGSLLRESSSPQAFLDKLQTPGFLVQDQWQVQILTQILVNSPIYVYTDGLSDNQIKTCLLEPVHDIAALCREEGRAARICVMPHGPLTIPYVG